MLKEMIQNQKSKTFIITFMILLFIVVYSVSQQKDKYVSSNLKNLDIEEISTVSGIWKVTEYLGESVEHHGAEAISKVESSEYEEIKKEIKDKYLN